MTETHENKIKKLEEQMKTDQQQSTKEHVKFCPKCGSEEIGVEAESLSPHDFCRACGFNSLKQDIVETMHFPTKSKEEKK